MNWADILCDENMKGLYYKPDLIWLWVNSRTSQLATDHSPVSVIFGISARIAIVLNHSYFDKTLYSFAENKFTLLIRFRIARAQTNSPTRKLTPVFMPSGMIMKGENSV